MYKKDYLQRYIEETGKVLAALLSLRKNKQLEEYEKEYETSFSKHTALNPIELELQTSSVFKENISSNTELSNPQLQFIADLMFEKLNYFLDKNQDLRVDLQREKCIFLYEHLSKLGTENEFHLGNHYRLNFLKQMK